MINAIPHIINIDLTNKINTNQSINIKKNDTNSHKFVINIFNNSFPYNLTGLSARIYFAKADKTIVFSDCTLDSPLTGNLSYVLEEQCTTCVGLIATEVTIYGTSMEILTSVTFNFTVNETVRDDSAIESSSEFTALTTVMSGVTEAIASLGDVNAINTALLANISSGNATDGKLVTDIATGNTLDTLLKVDTTLANTADNNLKADITNAQGASFSTEITNARKGETNLLAKINKMDTATTNISTIDLVNVNTYGAVGDGVTDDTVSIQNAINSGKSVFIPDKTYLVSALTTGTCPKIWGAGKLLSKGNNTILTVSNNYFIIDGIRFEGTNSGTNTLEIGININNKLLCKIVNCDFKKFMGSCGLYIVNIFTAHQGTMVQSCIFENNKVGYYSDALGEFTTLSNCFFRLNTIGLKILGGNNIVSACNIVENTDGIQLLAGTNDSHGIITGCQINHNTGYGINANGIANGETITGCHIYQNTIYLLNTVIAVKFTNCVFDCSISTAGCQRVIFRNNQFQNGYSGVYSPNFGSSPSTWLASGNTFASGDTYNRHINGGYVSIKHSGAMTLAVGANTIKPDTVLFNSTAFNPTDTANIFYDPATGFFTNRGLAGGYINMNINFQVTKLAGDTALGWLVTVADSAGILTIAYCTLFQFSTTLMVVSGTLLIPCDIGDSFFIRINVPTACTSTISTNGFVISGDGF